MDSSIFNNPAFSGMSPEKLQFLMSFAQKDKPTSTQDVLPLLLANMKQAQAQQLDLTKPEIQIICDLLCKNLPKEERERAQKVMSLLSLNIPN